MQCQSECKSQNSCYTLHVPVNGRIICNYSNWKFTVHTAVSYRHMNNIYICYWHTSATMPKADIYTRENLANKLHKIYLFMKQTKWQSNSNWSRQNKPVGESLDLRANDQLSGLTDAQCGSRSSTGRRNWSPWGPHITSGLSNVSPAHSIAHIYLSQKWFAKLRIILS